MQHRPRWRLRAALLACGTCLASSAVAEANLTFGTLLADVGDHASPQYGIAAREAVETLNSAGSAVVRYGHDALGLDDAGVLGRGLYAFTAYQALMRFHWANSIYLGHEGAHFATAHQFGLDDHYFANRETGSRISDFEAYKNIFLKMEVGGPAVSRGQLSPEEQEHHDEEGVMSTAAGLNWQMDFSESWLRDALTFQTKDAFDAPAFFMNRIYFTGYALGDILRREDGETHGDVYKWARHMEENSHSDGDTLDRVALYSLASNLLSPSFWTAAGAVGGYVSQGSTDADFSLYPAGSGGLTWDVPHYLNATSMTLSPTLYWSPASQSGGDALLLGAAVELAAIGDVDPELRLSATGKWDQVSYDTTLSIGGGGAYAETSMSYHFDDNLALNLGGAAGRGDTLHQARQMPADDAAIWAGVQFSF